MGKYIGIDLGTTFSVAAYIDHSGKPVIIQNKEGENITASAVLFEDGNLIVGTEAKRESVTNPEHFVGFVKRSMGNQHKHFLIDGRNYKPEEISAIILKKIKEDAEAALGEDILGAVITVPAYFTDAQRMATKAAAKIAGIPVLCIINEPTAAALSYGISKGDDHQKKILVYDLGGGTFDVSIMQFGANQIEILSSMGNPELGGYDFDMAIVRWFKQTAKSQGVDLEGDLEAEQELLMKAEDAKKALSAGRNKARITVTAGGKKTTLELSKEIFEGLIENIVYQTISLMDAALEEANIEYADLDKILLVGGSTRIPLVQQMIQEETKIEPSQDIHPDEAVAIGAAFHAVDFVRREKEGGQKRSDSASSAASQHSSTSEAPIDMTAVPEVGEQYSFVDRSAHGIGVVVYDHETNEPYNSIILPKNTRLPAEESQEYCTTVDYQESILMQVTQGESTEMKYTTIVGEAELKLRPKPKGAPIRVVISCDTDSIIHVHVLDLTDDDNLGEMRIDRVSNMSEEEVQEAKHHLGKLNIGWED